MVRAGGSGRSRSRSLTPPITSQGPLAATKVIHDMDFLYDPVGTTRLLAETWYALDVWSHNAPASPDPHYYRHLIIRFNEHAYRHGPPIHPHRAQVKAMILNALACTQKEIDMTTQENPAAAREKRHTPEVSPYKVSTHHLTKYVREILKKDEVMDGSGHLYVSPQYRDKITPDLITSAQGRVLAKLAEAYPDQAPDIEHERVHALVGYIITGAAQRKKPQPEPKRPPQQKSRASHKTAKPRKGKDHQRSSVKPRRGEEKRVVEVVVKRARPSFHYPRDLRIPGDES